MERDVHTWDWASFMMLSSANTLRLSAPKESKQAVVLLKDPVLFLAPSILMAFAAIETHVNEVIERYLEKNRDSICMEYIRGKLGAPIDAKLLFLTKYLTGKTFDWKSSLWKSFRELQKLRNKLMHYKLKDAEDKKQQGVFYKDVIHTELNSVRAKEAIETAKQVMKKLDFCYFGETGDNYKSIRI